MLRPSPVKVFAVFAASTIVIMAVSFVSTLLARRQVYVAARHREILEAPEGSS
jgi:hypothetical protein